MKNKKYLKATIGLCVGAIMLTSAVFANYENAGGYSVCKEALKKIAFADDFSMDYTMEAKFDGVTYEKNYGSYKINADGNPSLQTETTTVSDTGHTSFSKRTKQDESEIWEYHNGIERSGHVYRTLSEADSIATDITGDEETGKKLVAFLETLSDTLVGDLKNSFVLTSDEGGVRSYSVNLAAEQMPSYVTSGVSLLTSTIRKENSEMINGESQMESNEPFALLFGGGEPYVRDVSAKMLVDDGGNPVQITGCANIAGYDGDGNEHIFSVNVSLDFYDFGSTEIEKVSEEEMKGFVDNRRTESESVAIIGGADGPTAVYIK